MPDIVLDTNVLTSFIKGYYFFNVKSEGKFQKCNFVSKDLADRINYIIETNREYGTLSDGVILCSALGIIEIARKFESISKDNFSIDQFKAFVESPPEWFVIMPLNNDLFEKLAQLPMKVKVSENNFQVLEWADMIHVATALTRDEECFIAATDQRITKIPQLSERLII